MLEAAMAKALFRAAQVIFHCLLALTSAILLCNLVLPDRKPFQDNVEPSQMGVA